MSSMKTLFLSAVLAFAIGTSSASAVVIGLAYTATTFGSGLSAVTGAGSVTVDNSTLVPGLPNVTDFSFILTESDGTATGTTTYTLLDLMTFSAALDSIGNVTSLSLTTGFRPNTAFFNEVFRINSLSIGASSDNGIENFVSRGTTTASEVVPEPASMALLGAGIAGLGTIRRRAKRIGT